MEIASLVMSVDARPVKKASEELSKFTKQAATTEKAVDGVSDALTDAAKAAGVYRDASGKLREANGRFVSDARKVELGLDAVSENAKKASKSVKGLGDGAGSASTYLKTMATAAIAAFSVAAIVEFTRRTSVAIAEIERFAQLSNTTNEQFQKAAYAAARFGVEQEKLSDILKDTNDKFGDFFQTGAGPLADFFEQIAPRVGITADAFRGLSGADALGLYVKTLEEAGVNQQDMTFYLEALASDATLLQGVFKDGGAALAAYSAEAENLGIILSDQTIAQAREFQNQLASVNAIMGNAGKTITAEMLPALSAITTMFMNAIKESGGMGNAVSNAVDKSVRALAFILDAADAVNRVFGVIGRAGVVAFLALKSGAMDVAASIIEGPLDALNYLIRGFNELGQYIGTTFSEIEPPKFAQGLRQEAAEAAAAARIGMDDIQSILMEPLAGRTFIDLYEQAQQVGASLEVAGAAATNATVPFKRLGEEAGSASKDVVKLNKAVADGDHDAAAKAVEDYRKEVEQLEDRLDPVGKATKQYQKDVALLASAHARGDISTERYTDLMGKLQAQMSDTSGAASEWAQWTESALERVDGAFADAWKNIGDGFAGFRDSLTNAFKQMLAELAHMAITRPIVMQIGAALGIGGMQSGGQGLLGGLLGGGEGTGGFSIGNLLQYGQQAYSLFTGVGPAALAGYQSGGIMGALQGAGGYYGNLASSALGTVSGWFGGGTAATVGATTGGTGFGLGQSLVSGQIGNAAYAGAQTGASGALGQLSGSLGAIAGPLAGLYVAFKGYKSISAGYEFNRKDFDDDSGGVRLAAGVIDAYENGVTKLFGNSSFISKAFRIPVATFGSILGGLFGGGWQTKDSGLAFSVADGGFVGESFEYQKKKGGLFGSNKKRTNFSPLDAESAAQFQDAFAATEGAVADIFEQLSYTITDASLAGLNLERTLISTQGKTEEEIQQAIGDWFLSLGNSMTAELNNVFGTGLDLDFAGMQAFVNNLKGVNEVLRYLNVDMYESSVAGGKLAESLAAVSGGLEALAQNSQTYYDAFFTQAEKTADTIDAIQRAFKDADIELAGSREAYRAAVEAIDLTSDAGQQMFATMMALSGQAAAYFDIVEAQAAQANAGLMSGVNTAYNALVRSISAQQQKLQEAAQVSQSNIAGMLAVANSLDAALKRLRGNSDLAVRSLRAQAVMTLNSALVSARSGNSLAGFEGLQDALDVASQMDTDLYATLADFEREQGRTANLIVELEAVNGKQLTTEQAILRGIQDQIKKLDLQLELAQRQLDALAGVDSSVLSVADAVKKMTAAVVSALSALPDGSAQNATVENNKALIESVYQSVLGREVDDAGLEYWLKQLQSGNIDYDQLAKAIAADASKNPNDPGQGSASDYIGSSGGLSIQDQIEAAYREALGRTASDADEAYWAGLIGSGSLSVDQLLAQIKKDAAANGELPGFALGGVHSGGLRIVGENGPEIEATGPSRIFNAGQTAEMLGGGSQADEVAAMRAEMTDALRSIAKHTQQTARRVEYLERWDFDGLPEQRAAV